MEFYSATEKNEILSFPSKWMELESIITGSEGQKSRSSSYVDYRPKPNAVILLDMCHILRGDCAWEG
jgi:hypothetical protein